MLEERPPDHVPTEAPQASVAPVPPPVARLALDAPATRALLRSAVREAVALLHADGGLVYLLTEDGRALRMLEDDGVTSDPARSWARGLEQAVGSGMIGRAVAEGRVVVTGDYAADTGFVHTEQTDRLVRESGIASMVVAPLQARDTTLGAIAVFSTRRDAYADGDLALVRSLAGHAAVTLANESLIAELERSREQLTRRSERERTLQELIGKLAAIRDPEALLRGVLDAAVSVSDARGAIIDRIDERGALHVMTARVSGDIDEDVVEGPVEEGGIMELAARERRIVVTGDYEGDASFQHSAGPDGVARQLAVRSVVAAPLIAYDETVGVLAVYAEAPDAFDAESVRRISALADHAAIVIANARRMDELDRARRQQARRASAEQALREVGARLTAIRNPDEVLEQAVAAACRLVDGEWAEVASVEPDGIISWTYVYGLDDPELLEMQHAIQLRVGQGMLGRAALEQRTIVTGDYLADTSFDHRPSSDALARRAAMRSLVAAPLHAGPDQVIGVLAVHSSRPNAFDPEQVALVDAFADVAAVAMGNARLIAELDRSESRFRGLLAASPDIVFAVDADGAFTYLSDTVERLLGWSVAEMTGQHFSALIDIGSMGDALERWRTLQAEPGVVLTARFDLIHRDGRRLPYEIRSAGFRVDGRFGGVQGAARDVSERDRLERELRSSEERYRELVATSPDLIWEVDADGVFTFLSETIRDLIGSGPAEVIGRNFREILHPSTYDQALGAWAVVVGAPGLVHGSRFALLHRDGRAVPIENYSIGRVADDGSFIGAHGSARDLREREGLERDLRESEAKYRYLVENSPDIVWSADADGNITFLSDTSEALLGWRPEEAMGQHYSLLVHPSSVDVVTAEYGAAMARGEARELRYRFSGRHRDGSRVPLEMHARTIVEDGVYRGTHGAVRDLRERERMERDLRRHAAELAASEERAHLARELHDSVTQALFSMTLVTKSIELLMDTDPATARARLRTLSELQADALAEMRALIFELRPASLETDGLIAALRTHCAALQGRTGLAIVLDADDAGRLPGEVEAALFRIAQEALHNVVKHAAARQVRITVSHDAERATLVVEDDGSGFDPGGVFDGHLGIAGMRARAEKLGGRAQIASTRGIGTTVRIDVPLSSP
ncbi:MAG TPA: PAS domain S-box protein, partial [Candidatus Limnocylindrales bacterium]